MLKKYRKIPILLITLIFIFTIFLDNPTPANSQAQEKLTFIYLYGGTTQDYINQYQKTKGSIDIVSPNYFDLDANGEAIIKVDKALTTYMQKQGVKVIPFLSNHWDRASGQIAISTPEKREKLAQDLVQSVINHQLDGINIDLENLTYEDKDNLTAFIKILSTKLQPLNKELSIAVGSVEKHLTSGWKSAYDLANLSKYADYLFVMAYDQSWRGSAPGPVAALPWVEKQLQYMLTQIPKGKLILGVPFYGRAWTNGEGGGGITHSDTIQEVRQNKANISWHQEHKVPFVKYSAKGSTREIWFENARSTQEKIRLINKYDVAGMGGWRLGQEDLSLWNDISHWLRGSYFTDMLNHWAEKDVLFLNNQGIIAGRDYNTYDPDASVTRAEAVSILSRIFNWNYNISNPFQDVPNNHWAIKPILGAYREGVIAGIEAKKFGPQNNLTRAQLAVILQRAFQLELTDKPGKQFSDVPSSHWAFKEIKILNSHGLLGGRTESQFVPEGNVTRGELAALVTRVLK